MFSRAFSALLLLLTSEKLRYVRYEDNDDDDDERASIVCAGRSSCFPTRNCYVIPWYRLPCGARRPDPDDDTSSSKFRSFYDTLVILDTLYLEAKTLSI